MADVPWTPDSRPAYQRQEKRTASKPGARPQINSGRTWSSLRDVQQESPIGRVLIDNKTTEAASYTVTTDDWKSLKRDANRTPPGCMPALQIDIRGLRLFIVEEDLWDDTMNYIRLLESRLHELGL